MCNISKYLILFGVSVLGIVGIIKMTGKSQPALNMNGRIGKDIDKGLQKSVEVLAKATGHIQSLVEHIMNQRK